MVLEGLLELLEKFSEFYQYNEFVRKIKNKLSANHVIARKFKSPKICLLVGFLTSFLTL